MTMPQERPTGNRFLGDKVYLDGKWIQVEWESAGTTTDDLGHTLELYIPILPTNLLTPTAMEAIFDQIRVWDVTDNREIDLSYTERVALTPAEKNYLATKKPNELTTEEQDLLAKGYREIPHPARETLVNIKSASGEYLTPVAVFTESKFGRLRRDLVDKGVDSSLLENDDIEAFLLNQLQGVKYARVKGQVGETQLAELSPNFIESMRKVLAEMQTNPQNIPNILARFQPSQPQTQAQKEISWQQNVESANVPLQSVYSAMATKMTDFNTEKEYQQSIIDQLGTSAKDILAQQAAGKISLTEGTPLNLANQRVVGMYQGAVQRLTDIESGVGVPATNIQEQAREDEAQHQLEAEQARRNKPKKSAMDIEFDRLLAESRRPQRRTSL